MLRRALALAALALGVAAPSAGAATTLNVIPQGQSQPGAPWLSEPGALPADTQARMYDRLTTLFRDVTPQQLIPSDDGAGYFKSAALLPENDPSFITSETITGNVPGFGAVSTTIRRGRYGVPHIYSSSDTGVVFGAGYATAADRSLLLNQARFNGVAGLIDMPGVSGIQLVLGLYDYKPSQKIVDEVTTQQVRALQNQGEQGRQVLRDIDTYLAGINLWYSKNQPSQPQFTRTDVFAFNGIKAQFLGEGGGEEIGNAQFLDGLRSKFGRTRGSNVYRDLRGRYDSETAATTSRRFPWQTNVSVTSPRGFVPLRNNSFRDSFVSLPEASASSASAKAAAKVAPTDEHVRGPEQRASNILIAGGERSATGGPLFVGGPQIGYNYPGLTMEMGLYGPNIRVRGATSAPFPGYMLIGRAENYAWTLTSAGTDMIDTYAETLCGGSTRRYLYKGRCRRMERVDAGTISKGGKTTRAVFFRTVHGPVVGYATRSGSRTKVALAQRRSSYAQETVDQLFNQQMTYGRVKSAQDFIDAAKKTPQTFNSFYASANEMAFYTSGKLPMRPRGVNPDLPVDGRGRFEWTGYLAKSKQPHVINPSSGYIVNWNNKPARDFPSSDERWAEQSIQRDDLLTGELSRYPKATLANVLASANAAATQDVRIVRLWPTMKRMLDRGKSPSRAASAAYDLLQQWSEQGGSRVDRGRDGFIDAPGALVMDTAWRSLSSAGLCDRLGSRLCRQLEGRNGRFDAPPGGQYGGWHQYMWKDMRRMLGDKVGSRYSTTYCGNGRVSTCSRELWAALDTAARSIGRVQGDDPARWRQSTARELIEFSPIPLLKMQYTNRPSGIHQVMDFR